MNLFILNEDPFEAARDHVDKHVVKMPLEAAQILCTVAHRYGHTDVPYRATHQAHPCVIWAGETQGNFIWVPVLASSTRRVSGQVREETRKLWRVGVATRGRGT